MKKCTSCGAELSDEAKICRECGELQPDTGSESAFAMPYLSVSAPATAPKSDKMTAEITEDKPAAKTKTKLSKNEIDNLTDPRERAFAKQDRRNRMIRIAALAVAGVVAAAGAVYFLTRSTGYDRVLEKYISGRTSGGGSKYMDIVPELYLIEAEELYGMSRPDIRSTTESYLEYVEAQYENDFGSGLEFTYKTVSERESDNSADTDALEETILSAYGADISIDKAAYVSIKLTTKGSETQTTENMTMTFFEYDGKWYSVDAMQIVQYACVNAGYGLW